MVKRPKTGVFGLIKCLFILTGAAHGASSIFSNTTGVIQGTTPPTSLIYFFMQITIKAITSSENKNIGLNPVLNSSESFQSQVAIFSHFFIFFHDGRASPDRGSDGERHWHAGESVT